MFIYDKSADYYHYVVQSEWGSLEGEVIVKLYVVGGANQDLALHSFNWINYILE